MSSNYPFLSWRLMVWGLLLLSSQLSRAQCIDTFPYVEDFEADDGDWTSTFLGNSIYNTWTWGSPNNPVINRAASGSSCWITGNDPAPFLPQQVPYYYGENERSAVVSPCFDFSNLTNPAIKVNIWWNSEFGTDGTVLQASTDGGNSWRTVGTALDPNNWYNSDSITAMPGGGLIGWSGDTATSQTGSGDWVEAQHLLDGLEGEPNVRLRFTFASNGGNDSAVEVLDGFAFDDVVIADVPTINLGRDTVICFADSLVLGGCFNSGVSYRWNTSPLDTLCNLVATSSSRYILLAEDTLGFIIRDTIRVTVSNTFVNLGPDRLICPDDTLTLDASNPNATYRWFPGGQTTPRLDVTETGRYKVIATDNFNCVETDSINVVVDFVPEVDLGNDTTICTGSSLQLDAGSSNPGTQYQWSPISASTQTVFVSSPGTYGVEVVTQAGCTESDTIDVGVSLAPVVNLGADRSICDSIRLNASNPGSAYQWSTGDTTQRITVRQDGTYGVRVTNPTGCTASDTVRLTVATGIPFELGEEAILCGNQPLRLNIGVSGQRYRWSNGDTTPVATIRNPGRVIARLISGAGCETRDTIQVVRSTLTVDLGADRSLCEGDSATLLAGPGATDYRWSTGAETQQITVGQAGTYSVSLSDTLGCQLRDTITLRATPGPTADFTYSGDTLLNAPIQFADRSTGNNITRWRWDFGDGTTSRDQNPEHQFASEGAFDVCLTVTDASCSRTTCQTIVIAFVGLEDEWPAGTEVDLYPNPSAGEVWLDLTQARALPVEVALLDLQGRSLLQRRWAPTQELSQSLDLNAFPAGLYVVALKVGDQLRHFKLKLR